MDIKEILAIRLRNILEEKNMTQYELSKKSTVTEATISNFINCKQLPKLEVVSKISDVLGVSVDYLLGKSDFKKYEKNTTSYAMYHKYDKLPEEAKKDVDKYIAFLESNIKDN